MGEVYRAEDLKLRQPVALKLISVRVAPGDEHLERFIAEVRLARDIAHPSVCRVYDIGEAEGWHYLSMEFVDGETLESLLRRIGRLPGEKALDIARQLCAGLAAAHDRGVLHRDLKPSNIMVDGRGRIRIMDFGLAVSTSESTIGELAGTPAYMAPEQLAGDRITERTDLFALGLVFYELFAGRALFPVHTVEERVNRRDAEAVIRDRLLGVDPILERIIDSCLEPDPTQRPPSALAIAAVLPGGDPLAAALAEGRVPSPDMVAAAGPKGALRAAVAWSLISVIFGGTLAVATQGHVLSVAPFDVPKQPEVLAERARDILRTVGVDDIQIDNEFWFAPDARGGSRLDARGVERIPVTFTYRQSPEYLVPQNAFHLVTDRDPAADVPGMDTVTLDSSGQLVRFERVPSMPSRSDSSAVQTDWDRLFSAAGLVPRQFVPAEPQEVPRVAHDNRLAWDKRAALSDPVRVTAATLDGTVVHFDVQRAGVRPGVSRNPFSRGRSPSSEALFWGLVVSMFVGAGMLARHNLRLGQGDRRGARNVSLFVICGNVVASILRAHHVPLALEELSLVFGALGWALVWGGFTWLLYMSLEPYVRRVWPKALISWARLMSGRWRDPLVGSDVIVGLVAGIIRTGMVIGRLRISHRAPPDAFFTQSLESLRSVRHFIDVAIVEQVIEALATGLGTLFLLFLIRLVVRKTWIATAIVALLGIPLGFRGGEALVPWEMIWVVGGMLFALIILERVGLLAYVVMLFFTGLVTRAPLTLDPAAWNAGTSLVTLLVIAALGMYGFMAAVGRRPALRIKAA